MTTVIFIAPGIIATLIVQRPKGQSMWSEEVEYYKIRGNLTVFYSVNQQITLQIFMSHKRYGPQPRPGGDLGMHISNEAMGPLNK